MAQPNRPSLNIDDAENIRKFSSLIRRSASGQKAFPSSHERGNADAPSTKPSQDSSHVASPGSPEQGHADADPALNSNSTMITPEVTTPELPAHQLFEHAHLHRLQQLPRAVQQLRSESPSLNGIQAPHSTPQSFRPSPITGIQHLPEPSNEEIGMAIDEVLSSLPSAGKYGIDDSIWARGPRPKVPYGPKYTDKDTQLVGLTRHQGQRTEKEEAEAREHAKEHNQTFARMSFKIADAPSLGNAYAGNAVTQNAPNPDSVIQAKEQLQLLSPRSTTPTTTHASGNIRAVGTQTTDDDFVMASKPTSPVDSWVRIDSPQPAFVSSSAAKSVSSLASEFKRVAEDVGKAFDKIQQPGYQPTAADLEAVSALGYTLGFLKGHMGDKSTSGEGPSTSSSSKADGKYAKFSKDAYGSLNNLNSPAAKKADSNSSSTAGNGSTNSSENACGGLKIKAPPVEESAILDKYIPIESTPTQGTKLQASETEQPEQSDVESKAAQAKDVVEHYARAQMDTTAPAEQRLIPIQQRVVAKKGASPSSILAAGTNFAKSRQNAYGAPKTEVVVMREPKEQLPDSLVQPAEQPQLAVEVPEADAGDTTPRMPSGPSLSALTPSSMEFTLASPATVAAAGIAARVDSQKEIATGNREKALYFGSWGKPEARAGAAPEKRSVIISGDPSWEEDPTPSFIADLVFGGPLEQIHCMEHTAKVTFLDGDDAKHFVDATPNDILFAKGKYAVVKWVEDVTPMSSLVQQYIDNGCTRCVQAIGTDDFPIEKLKATAGGKLNRLGRPMRKVEHVEKGTNARGHHVVTFRFCDIRDAITFKAEMTRDEEWEIVNMQFTTDPCSGATSAFTI